MVVIFQEGNVNRLAIARALLSGKDILLMDEATSALDEQTANDVENSILSLENITCISVTHRLSRENMKKIFSSFEKWIMENCTKMFYDISAESVEIYRRNHVNCNLLPYRIDADVLY